MICSPSTSTPYIHVCAARFCDPSDRRPLMMMMMMMMLRMMLGRWKFRWQSGPNGERNTREQQKTPGGAHPLTRVKRICRRIIISPPLPLPCLSPPLSLFPPSFYPSFLLPSTPYSSLKKSMEFLRSKVEHFTEPSKSKCKSVQQNFVNWLVIVKNRDNKHDNNVHTHTHTHTGTQTHTQAHTDTSSSTEYGNAQPFYFNILFGVVVLYLASWKNLEFGLCIFWWVCGEVLLVQSFWDTEGLSYLQSSHQRPYIILVCRGPYDRTLWKRIMWMRLCLKHTCVSLQKHQVLPCVAEKGSLKSDFHVIKTGD